MNIQKIKKIILMSMIIFCLAQGIEAVSVRQDVNQDKYVSTVDAMLTLRSSFGFEMSETSWKDTVNTGDVDCNNNLTSMDTQLLLKKSLGFDMTGTNWCNLGENFEVNAGVDKNISENTSTVLHCTSSGSDGTITYKWIQGTTEVASTQNYITPTLNTGSYTYTCIATSSYGDIGMDSTTVLVGNFLDSDFPEITLNGDKTITLEAGENYIELGASAYDNIDGNISSNLSIDSNVDTNKAGYYTVRYHVKNSKNKETEVVRNVHVLLKVFDFPSMKQVALDKNFVRSNSFQKATSYNLRLAKGEYHSIAMLIEPEKSQDNFIVQKDNFVNSNPNTFLDKSIMDTYIAKRWFQAGDVKPGHETLSMYNYKINGQPTIYYNQKWLTQELLLKDENLVQVDFANETNKLRVKDNVTNNVYMIDISSRDDAVPDTSTITFDDAQTLQPFDLVKDQHKLLWSIIHVPKNANSGIYTSTFRIKNSNGDIVKSIPIQIEVLPFELDESKLTYGIYYTPSHFDTNPRINTATKTIAQHRVLLQNLKDHGVLYPNTYLTNPNDFRTDLQIRKSLGFPTDKVYTLGAGLFSYKNSNIDSNTINQIVSKINQFKAVYNDEGYTSGGLYVYGFDEAVGNDIQKEIDAIRDIRQSTSINFFATGDYRYYSGERLVGDLDLLIYPRYTLDDMILMRYDNSSEWKYSINASNDMVNLWHSNNKKIYAYNAPQGGVESAEVYRRNYGVRLWKEGYDGAMDWGYQYGRIFVWNDFLSDGYRDETFVYQTTNGVINTVQWEGFRQAVIDVKYLSTLSNLRDRLSGNARQEIDDFLNNLNPNSDLDVLRDDMIDLILKWN